MKILVISPFFAPYALVGARRINSLAAYLINKEHNVTVITLSTDYYHALKQDSVAVEIPAGVKVIRFDVPANLHGVFRRNRTYARLFYACADRLLEKEQFDIALLSLGPFFPLQKMPQLCKKYKLPYILDYRDLNSLERLRQGIPLGKVVKSVAMKPYQYWIDKKAMNAAAAIITVTKEGKRRIEKKLLVSAKKVHVVFNGFDSQLSNRAINLQWNPDARLAIGYFGKFMYYDAELGFNLLKAVSNLREKGIDAKFYHIGPETPNITQRLAAIGVDVDCYVPIGYKQYSEGIAYLKKMDCCAIEWNNVYGYGTKIFDYISVNKPVLASTKRSTELASFLKGFKNAFVCETAEELENSLLKIFCDRITMLDEAKDMSEYSRMNQNAVFEQLLKRYSKDNAQ